MKTIILVLLVLVIGIWIGTLWSTNANHSDVTEGQTASTTDATATTSTDTEAANNSTSTETALSTSDVTVELAAEPIVVDSAVLSDGQKKLLETFGVDTEAIEITAEMIQCAESEVGQGRMDEIIGGATPTFLEGFALVGCYRQ